MSETEKNMLTDAEKDALYDTAARRMKSALCEWELQNAASLFEQIGGWRDADARREECLRLAEETRVEALYRNAVRQMKQVTSENGYLNTAEAFRELKGYKDAEEKRAECLKLAAESRLEDVYTEAMKIFHREKLTVNDCRTAKMLFEKLPGYKDADAQAALCDKRAEEVGREHAEAEAALTRKRRQKKKARAGAVIITVAVVLGIIAGNVLGYLDEKVWQPERVYRAAGEALLAGDAGTAYELYQTIPGYKDAETILRQDPAIAAVRRSQAAALCRVPGSIVRFGEYQQTYLRFGGPDPIEWLVLEYDEAADRALLLSLRIIDAKPYHAENKAVTWADCSLRAWLNDGFVQTAFSEREQQAILTTRVDNSASQGYAGYNTDGGPDTEDKVFLLSYAEAWRYFESKDTRSAERTAWALYKEMLGHADRYFLRSPGNYQNMAAVVFTDGTLTGGQVMSVRGVRPAMWVDVKTVQGM